MIVDGFRDTQIKHFYFGCVRMKIARKKPYHKRGMLGCFVVFLLNISFVCYLYIHEIAPSFYVALANS